MEHIEDYRSLGETPSALLGIFQKNTLSSILKTMIDFDRMIKDCYWDRHVTKHDIQQIINGSDMRSKKQLFEKILLNSSHYLLDLQIFNRTELEYLLNSYRVPSFNHAYTFRRKHIAEVFFFNKDLEIQELKWNLTTR